MKIKNSSLVKSLNKKNNNSNHHHHSHHNHNNNNNNNSNNHNHISAPPHSQSKLIVHHVKKTSDQQIKHSSSTHKNQKANHGKVNSFREQTQELLERNFKQMKSLQKSEAPIMIAEPTFVYTSTLHPSTISREHSKVLDDLDNLIQRDSVLKKQQQQQQLTEAPSASSSTTAAGAVAVAGVAGNLSHHHHQMVNNKFEGLLEDMNEEEREKKPTFMIQPATFQLPERNHSNSSRNALPSAVEFNQPVASFNSNSFELPSLPAMILPEINPLPNDDIDPDL